MYLRFAALGDSTTFGIGDPLGDGWRGWARILAAAMGRAHDVSFCNVAVSGATARAVRTDQLRVALGHQPTLASLIVGVNDTMRSTWDPVAVRDDLMSCAEALHGHGALLLTVRFHDHGEVFGLPGFLRRPLMARIEAVNRAYDEVYAHFGGIRVDLADCPEVRAREFWSVDRLHPSELGHRALAAAFADRLATEGIAFPRPSQLPTGPPPTWRSDLSWMVTEGVPWFGRRARDLGPWAARLAVARARRTPSVMEPAAR
ncbi:SGNH/GDSL hydrolase family protein [Nocardioides limicola]|uniref:SGNH/GDSL hydrolase family protein n=1 Tax=Nocardioides limicola TaxID=2803368 RepID=UPI00193C4CF5|nr:SGNH/GDSL hydrolase family protein [Nocardioides sp. DJM-14]